MTRLVMKVTVISGLVLLSGALTAKPAFAKVTGFTITATPIWVGKSVMYSATTDGLGPLAISYTWEYRCTTSNPPGAWINFGNQASFQIQETKVGTYDVRLTVKYMGNPMNPPPDDVYTKVVEVLPPDDIELTTALPATGIINQDMNVNFSVRYGSNEVSFTEGFAIAEERISQLDLVTGGVVSVGDWVTGDQFKLTGGNILDLKRVAVKPLDWDLIDDGATVGRIRQEIRIKYYRCDNVLITSPVLGTFDFRFLKVGAPLSGSTTWKLVSP